MQRRTNIFSILLFVLLLLVSPVNPAYACPDVDGLVDLNCDGQVTIVCFGDSITEGWGDNWIGYPGRLQILLPNVRVFNFGISGEKTPVGRQRAPSVFSAVSNPDYAIILEGVNDFFLPNPNASSTRNNLLNIVSTAQASGAIALLGTLTAVKRGYQIGWVNDVNAQIRPFTLIDFYSLGDGIISSDLLHPNGAGYQVMAEFVWARLDTIGSSLRPADNDMDGLYDFAEPSFGANPALADTDGDGLLDGAEVFEHGSNPNNTDTDGDGFDDAQEVNVIGSDPASPRPSAPNITKSTYLPRGDTGCIGEICE